MDTRKYQTTYFKTLENDKKQHSKQHNFLNYYTVNTYILDITLITQVAKLKQILKNFIVSSRNDIIKTSKIVRKALLEQVLSKNQFPHSFRIL